MSKLPDYQDNPLAYYAVLKTLTPKDLEDEWQEITCQDYDYLLDCVPPRAIGAASFLVGECMTHTEHGPIYEAVVCLTCLDQTPPRRYFSRPAHVKTWINNDYVGEIKRQFRI